MKVHSLVLSRPHNSNPLSLWTRTKYSNTLDDLFLHAFFFLGQEILNQHFLGHKILHIYSDVCCFFAIKNKCTNICDTNNCNAKFFDAKNDVAKIKSQKFLCIYFCNINFSVKNFCVTIFCVFIFATVYSAAYIFVYLIMQKSITQIMV